MPKFRKKPIEIEAIKWNGKTIEVGVGHLERESPVCGEDFCDACGDCMHCYGDDECPSHGSHSWLYYLDDLSPQDQAKVQRACAKCGNPTRREEAFIGGEIWCHPCADKAPH